jgi:hypothetical protein
MKLFVLLSFALATTITAQQYPSFQAELLQMEKVDQDARLKCTDLKADEQIKCLSAINDSVDVPHTKRLEEMFDQIGFPNTAKVGKDGMQAFMILLQHVAGDELRVKALKPITKAFEDKELPAMDYANFVDRLRLHQGKKQLYGTGFDFKGDKMVMSPTEDIKNLDKRRAKVGLPPMSEAIKMMKELYHLEVVISGN